MKKVNIEAIIKSNVRGKLRNNTPTTSANTRYNTKIIHVPSFILFIAFQHIKGYSYSSR